MRRLGDPTISVIITNHNYGHFLATCIESVLDQTRPPEQIIVVDDGSTDGSHRVLDRYRDRIEVIATENRGQAAAFNTGFAASSGNLVLFLDADDALKHDCLETVLTFWHDGLSVLTFGLEEVDEAGCSLGVHRASVETLSGDNRPELLATGTFAFPPTSGNVFSRGTLSAALPMPEERWRISADCFLIRAAALLGRFEAVAKILGEYRLHGGNNYARSVAGLRDTSVRRGNQRDIADALDDIARTDALLPEDPAEAEALVAALTSRAAAIRGQTGPLDASQNSPECGAFLRSRWPVHLGFGETHDFREEGAHRMAAVPAMDGFGYGLPSALRFAVDPSRGPLVVTAGFEGRGDDDTPCFSEVRSGAEVVWSGFVSAGETIALALPKAPWEGRRVVDLSLSSGGDLGFRSLRIEPSHGVGAAPRLAHGQRAGLSFDGWPGLSRAMWTETAHGIGLTGSHGRLDFSADLSRGADLVLGTGPETTGGHLRLGFAGQTVFEGTLSGRRDLVVPLPRTQARGERAQCVDLKFFADDAGAACLELVHVGLRIVPASRAPAPPLNPGERVGFGSAPNAGAFLAGGWSVEPDEGARNTGAEAEMAFSVPVATGPGSLRFVMRPLMPPLPETRHVVGFSVGGEMVAVADLEGAGTCEVALPAVEAGTALSIGVHSILVTGTSEGAQPSMAPLEVIQMEYVAAQIAPMAAPPFRRPAGKPELDGLLDEVEDALAATATDGAPGPGALSDLRERLLGFLGESGESALLILSDRRRDLEAIARLGARLSAQPLSDGAAAALARIRAENASSPGARLREALSDMLVVPAFRSRRFEDPANLPAPLYWRSEAVETYITMPPVLGSPEDQRAYADWLGRLYANLDAAIAREPDQSAAFRMCAGVLERLRAVRVIFGDGCLAPMLRDRSRAIERLLARRGAQLAWKSPERPDRERLRVGVLVRDVAPNPEGWALLGMWAGIDRNAVEPILITMVRGDDTIDTGDRFERTVVLSGLSVDDAVEEIRGLDLDLFLTGCYAFDLERVSSVVAHRLARVQVWQGAVCPSTGGFRSFDVALTNRATEPEDAQRHYTETLAWIDGPVQCAYDFGEMRTGGLPPPRRELGLPDDAALAVSGAMAHKITDPLLDAWAAILAGSPGAHLVLYPFASNWSMEFEADAFLDRVSRALAHHGVAGERVIVLPTQTPERVGRLVSAADLYLDSFPYSGATTVCEALSRGTPVLALEGGALRQLTGTSWVRAYGEDGFVASTREDYIATAIRVLTDAGELAAARERIEARLADSEPPHCATEAFGHEFGAALAAIALGAGIRPPAAAAEPRPPPERRRKPSAGRITKFGIFASPRTGSMFLCHLLNLTPGVICHFELFHDDMIQYRDGDVTDADAIAERNADPVGFLRRTMAEADAEGRRAVGFKQFGHLSRAVTEEMAADRDMRLIRLSRANLLAQYSSERIAKATDSWISKTGADVRTTLIAFDIRDFEGWEAHTVRVNERWTELLARSGRDALFLDYTRVFHPETPALLSAFLGFEVRDPRAVGLQRQNTDNILGRFTNPDEVEVYLKRRGLLHWAEGG